MNTNTRTLRGHLVLSLLVASLLGIAGNVSAQSDAKLAAGDAVARQGNETVSGWRGDGSGRYPNADPPLQWGRTARSVKEHSAQARKPQDGTLPAKEGVPNFPGNR